MRKSLFISGVALAGSLLIGCGGGGDGLNTASKVIVGYVYVSTDNTPTGSPSSIVTGSVTPPSGFVAPTAGTFTLAVDDGDITRGADSEAFDMSVSNEVIAHVVSKSSGTPQVKFSATGLQNAGSGAGTARPNIPLTSANMSGANETVQTLSYGSVTPAPIGAPASIQVKIKNPSAFGANAFGAPATVMPSIVPVANSADDYVVAVTLIDVNGNVIPGTNAVITDPNGNVTESAVAETATSIHASGGGVEGTNVTITFSTTQAPNLTLSYTAPYSYGNQANFVATFSPVGPTSLIWPAAGPAATQAYTCNVKNGLGVVVPNLTVGFRGLNTAGTVQNNYPAPASGSRVSSTTGVTDAAGNVGVTFNTPAGAAGNAAFNSLNIKYQAGFPLVGNKLQLTTNGGNTVAGQTEIIINRPLANLNIQGASRLDINTSSRLSGPFQYLVTAATDIDTQVIAAPVGTYSWTLTPIGNSGGTVTVGDADDTSARSVCTPTFIGSVTGPSVQIAAGSVAGQFTLKATFNTTDSNLLTTDIYGPPAKITLNPVPTAGGVSFTAGQTQNITCSFVDAFGHAVSGESTATSKSGSITSGNAVMNTIPSLPSLIYSITASTTVDSNAQFTLGGTWNGTGQGITTGSNSWSITRNTLINIP